MIYPLTIPEPLISTGTTQSSASFKTTRFDYKSRQRAIPRGYISFNANFVMDSTELLEFITLYEDAEETTGYKLDVDWLIHANDNLAKEIRIIKAPSISAQGNLMYNVSISCEVLDWGNASLCPLYPSQTIAPSNTLYPC